MVSEMGMAWICTGIACLGFGCNFVPAKMVDIRDGNFFSLMVAVGVWLVGLVQWFILEGPSGSYVFEPIAMIGGAIWALGNLMVPFIIKNCGLGVGQLVWCAGNMLTGWATGTFGLFGIEKNSVKDPALNYMGVALAVVALILFTQMGQKKEAKVAEADMEQADEPLAAEAVARPSASGFVMGLVCAVVAGVLFGANFDPPTRLMQLAKNQQAAGLVPTHPLNPQEYVFSHYSGILALTILAFSAIKLVNRAVYVDKSVVLPGLVAGILWGIAQIGWFQANAVLSFVIAFPIITGVPGVLSAILGVVLFGENKDPRSLKLLCLIIFIQALSLGCVAVST
jgi:glucose uptake protein GlcU